MRICFTAILPLLVLPNVSCLAATKPSTTVISRRKNGSRQEYIFDSSTTSRAGAPLVDGGDSSSSSITTTTSNTVVVHATPTTTERSKGGSPPPVRRLSYWIKSTFLPVGYPSSVQPDYIEYSIWNALQDWSTSLRSTLATQRILEGVGVGQSTATAVSAVQNFLVRDAAGMAATLLFTASTQFGANVKQWRLFADIMVDIGITLEVAAIQVPKRYFLLMLCFGNICKAVCGVAAGAAGVPIVQYWGKDTADVSAKAGAQRTVVGAIGLVVSALFARWSSSARQSQVWLLYIGLTVFHIFANIRCLKTVAFSYFNLERLEKVASAFLDAWSKGRRGPLPDPMVVGRIESNLFLPKRPNKGRIRFGVAFNDLAKQSHVDPLVCRDLLQRNGYCCCVVPSSSSSLLRHQRVLVALTGDATPYIKTKAYFHALLLQRVHEKTPTMTAIITDQSPHQCAVLAENIAMQEIESAWDRFVQDSTTMGWDIDQSNLQTAGYELWVAGDATMEPML